MNTHDTTYESNEEQIKLGWATLARDRTPDWAYAKHYLHGLSLQEVFELDAARQAILLPSSGDGPDHVLDHLHRTLARDLEVVSEIVERARNGEPQGLSLVELWDQIIFVIEEDTELVERMTRLHAAGGMVAAGFEEEL